MGKKAASKRRSEGSIYETKVTTNGKAYAYWTAAVTLRGPGRRQRETYRFKTRAEARAKLREALREAPKAAGPRMTVADYLAQWLGDKIDLKPTTLKRYRQHCLDDIAPRLGRVRLDKLTADEVQRMIHDLEKHYAPNTVRNVRAVLRTALNDAMAKRYITYNAAEPVKLPRARRFDARILAQDEVGRFFEAVNGDRLGSLFAVTLGLGLRKGEALGLTWDRIDFKKGTVTIDRQLQGDELVETKTSTRRVVPLTPPIAVMLEKRQAEQKREALAAGWRDPEGFSEGFVFTTMKGNPYGQRNVVRDFKHYLARAGLPSAIRFQDLRGSAATFFNDLGYDIKTAQATLGHADIRTTLKYYTQVNEPRQREALERLGRMIPA